MGIMGWADMLMQLRIQYDSNEAIRLAGKVMQFIQRMSWEESAKLSEEKGEFPLWKKSSYVKRHPVLSSVQRRKSVKVRNLAITTIAPTGTISMLADCSSGIEPVFALAYVKNVIDQEGLAYTNRYFVQAVQEFLTNGDRSQADRIISEVSRNGNLSGVTGIPKWMYKVFRTAHEIQPEWHVKMQAAFQKYTDKAGSKKINFSETE